MIELLGVLGGPRRVPQAKRIVVGKEMFDAMANGIEWYQPTFVGLKLEEEGGHSKSSYDNLCQLMTKLDVPSRVERLKGNVLVSWPGENYYFATGFDCGYFGTGPYYFAQFGEKAGFGEVLDLYDQITNMDREFAGVVWER